MAEAAERYPNLAPAIKPKRTTAAARTKPVTWTFSVMVTSGCDALATHAASPPKQDRVSPVTFDPFEHGWE